MVEFPVKVTPALFVIALLKVREAELAVFETVSASVTVKAILSEVFATVCVRFRTRVGKTLVELLTKLRELPDSVRVFVEVPAKVSLLSWSVPRLLTVDAFCVVLKVRIVSGSLIGSTPPDQLAVTFQFPVLPLTQVYVAADAP